MQHLVLGGGGFIGYHLVERLLETDIVRVFDCDLSKYRNVTNPSLELVTGDFQQNNLEYLFNNVDIVWHLISTTVAIEGTRSLSEEMCKNVLPTIQILEAMVKQNVPKIIFLSSGGTIYGEKEQLLNEDVSLDPICSYGVQKLMIEKCINLYQRYHGIRTIMARLSNPYGVKQSLKRRQGVIPIFISQIQSGRPIEIWGDGSAIRDYIYIDDAINALLCLSNYEGGYSVFNIASGERVSLNTLVDMISKEMHIKPQVNYHPGRLCDVHSNHLDTQRIYSECGWKAKIDLQEGIRRLLSLN